MVDAERIGARLDRMEHLLERLEGVRGRGEDAYLADEGMRAMTERWLQVAIQTCIDIGAQLAAELAVEAPADYASVFANLSAAGHLDADLAKRLARAAGQRNILVHLYLDLDDREVFSALKGLDDLREFAKVAQRLAEEGS